LTHEERDIATFRKTSGQRPTAVERENLDYFSSTNPEMVLNFPNSYSN